MGSAALGAAVGTAAGAAMDGWTGAGIGGLAGAAAFGLASTLADAAVKDVTFMAITDVEIAERVEDGVIVREDRQQDAKQGIGGARRQSSTKVSEMNKYRTRVVSTANKVNLQYEEAAPELTNGLARSISGLFNSLTMARNRASKQHFRLLGDPAGYLATAQNPEISFPIHQEIAMQQKFISVALMLTLLCIVTVGHAQKNQPADSRETVNRMTKELGLSRRSEAKSKTFSLRNGKSRSGFQRRKK